MVVTMKLFVSSLPLLLCLLPACVVQAKRGPRWNGLQNAEDWQNQKRTLQTRSVRGMKKDPEDGESGGKSSKKKLAKKDKCNKDRRSVVVTTSFDGNDVNTVTSSNIAGTKFNFTGDYSGTWTQTEIEVAEEIRLEHDRMTTLEKRLVTHDAI